MGALDGKIEIRRELRPCVVKILARLRCDFKTKNISKFIIEEPQHFEKALFHMWNPKTGKAIVEYDDGTVHEAEL